MSEKDICNKDIFNKDICSCNTVEIYSQVADTTGCPNTNCEYCTCDYCPECTETGFLVGDHELFFECTKRHMWPYHYECKKDVEHKSKGQFIKWRNSKEDSDDETEEFDFLPDENNDYQDGSSFFWLCMDCGEEFETMMCG